ncbi:hypothetical protein O181_091956 [Austropuccinia psidii MF-1]|uniref:Uncharacterized protein n=1 Tax=Austropuccinia psidii MF-1 TaxID=1389203 RepID=A0A9Q3IYJ3_9BASI|nr:hypothetical protein [Austropuccinia psidii MF-1]
MGYTPTSSHLDLKYKWAVFPVFSLSSSALTSVGHLNPSPPNIIPNTMNPPHSPESDVFFDEIFNRVFQNSTELNSSLSYQDEPISHSSINSSSTPNQSTEPHECYSLFNYLNSQNIVPPAPITHHHIFPCPPPNNINRTPFQLDITNTPNMSLGNPPPNTPQTLPPPSFIEFDINNPLTQVQSISANFPLL